MEQTEQNLRLGVFLILFASFIFGMQDGLSRHLATLVPPVVLVMMRYWFMAVFVIVLTMYTPGGIKRALHARRPFLQITRGVLLVAEIVIINEAFIRLGLVATHAVFTAYPLISVALSVTLLGERVGWRRWLAVFIGFLGVLVILRPGGELFTPTALLALASATMFALYGVLTRMVSHDDPPIVSFFWTGIAGVVAITIVGLPQWTPMPRSDWGWLALLCMTGVTAHWLMIRAYSVVEASALQPFSYSQLLWVTLIGFFIFGERVGLNVIFGGLIIVAAGLFTLLRARKREKEAAADPDAVIPPPVTPDISPPTQPPPV